MYKIHTIVFIVSAMLLSIRVDAQEPVDVTEQNIKIGAFEEEELYFGFAAGDKIIFSFQETDKKELKEIEIIEYPTNSKFSEYKTKKIENKIISVNQTGVYIFRFKNSAIGGRVCKIKIQRIPLNSETIKFNSNVTWETKQETTYNTYTKNIVVGYDTTYLQKTKRELISSEQKEEVFFDKTQRVHNRTSLFFTLPTNVITAYKTKKVVAWAYWVGVGEEANQAWKQNIQALGKIAKGAATYFTTPLGALAIGAVADLIVPKIGEDVIYAISDRANRDLFQAGLQYRIFDNGKGIAGYRKFDDQAMCQGTFFVLLANDNLFQGIDATVKVIAIVETSIYEDKQYTEMNVQPRYEKKTFSDPVIKTSKVPVTGK